ncbi:VraH family peptide resistance protein [Macrococcus equipercicus]|uniref:VraH family protein n=1 Tax=Macrococcus equipercicus TaxID=69967 RepID=A0A9Q9BVG7_9STAP|nr:VraH family protein [Macrococcus equipercicus]UTH13117.1 VraH family protein [Macrococcus equipercicus]
MTVKEFFNSLLEKKWTMEDLLYVFLSSCVASIIVTPLFALPVGIIVYYYFFFDNDED